ncbi:hypothetical protein GFC29_3842 (plasmid) [Anoxybacillus sp. B7M1]|nr:hypothetical protein [Anoxybacillus sp. B7M1]ANB66154.1 hypothetical protein GFC29_3842 [Anoxybacillus sp. B7M1]
MKKFVVALVAVLAFGLVGSATTYLGTSSEKAFVVYPMKQDPGGGL